MGRDYASPLVTLTRPMAPGGWRHAEKPSRCSPPPPAALPCNHLPPSHRLPWDRTEEADAARNSLEWRNIFEQLGEVGVLRRSSTIQQLRNIGGKTEDNHFLMDWMKISFESKTELLPGSYLLCVLWFKFGCFGSLWREIQLQWRHFLFLFPGGTHTHSLHYVSIPIKKMH